MFCLIKCQPFQREDTDFNNGACGGSTQAGRQSETQARTAPSREHKVPPNLLSSPFLPDVGVYRKDELK